jgi:hypothetical protein
MPGRHAQFGVVAVSNRSPTSRERLLNNVRRIDFIDAAAREDIDGTAESAVRIERIDGVSRRDVHVYGLGPTAKGASEKNEPTTPKPHGRDYNRRSATANYS